jgi:hypothetical protein
MPIHRGVLAAYSRQVSPNLAANTASSSLAARFNATANTAVRVARRGSAKSRVQPAQMTTSDTYIGLRLKRYGPARRRYSGASVATLSRRSGAASKCWARDQATPAVPATRHPTPARRAAPRCWAPVRCDRRASATGRSACAPNAPVLHTSTTADLGSFRLMPITVSQICADAGRWRGHVPPFMLAGRHANPTLRPTVNRSMGGSSS